MNDQHCERCGSKLIDGRRRVFQYDTFTGAAIFEALAQCPRWRWWHVLPTPHARKWQHVETK